MGAWKSSDGGAVTAWGGSAVHVSLASSQDIVSAATNVRGLTIRSAFVLTGGSSSGFLTVDGVRIAGAGAANIGMVYPREIYVPAGVAVALERLSGTIGIDLSYDLY